VVTTDNGNCASCPNLRTFTMLDSEMNIDDDITAGKILSCYDVMFFAMYLVIFLSCFLLNNACYYLEHEP
jgi:hypothetical protein